MLVDHGLGGGPEGVLVLEEEVNDGEVENDVEAANADDVDEWDDQVEHDDQEEDDGEDQQDEEKHELRDAAKVLEEEPARAIFKSVPGCSCSLAKRLCCSSNL